MGFIGRRIKRGIRRSINRFKKASSSRFKNASTEEKKSPEKEDQNIDEDANEDQEVNNMRSKMIDFVTNRKKLEAMWNEQKEINKLNLEWSENTFRQDNYFFHQNTNTFFLTDYDVDWMPYSKYNVEIKNKN